MILRDDQLHRVKELKLLASVQISSFLSACTEEFESVSGPERVEWVARYRELLHAGIFTAGSADLPWRYGQTGSASKALYQSVTRIGENGDPPADWQLDQPLTCGSAEADPGQHGLRLPP